MRVPSISEIESFINTVDEPMFCRDIAIALCPDAKSYEIDICRNYICKFMHRLERDEKVQKVIVKSDTGARRTKWAPVDWADGTKV